MGPPPLWVVPSPLFMSTNALLDSNYDDDNNNDYKCDYLLVLTLG